MDGSRGRERRAGGRRDGLRPPSGGKLGLSRRELLLLAGVAAASLVLSILGCGGSDPCRWDYVTGTQFSVPTLLGSY
jgi:hypothetical protein